MIYNGKFPHVGIVYFEIDDALKSIVIENAVSGQARCFMTFQFINHASLLFTSLFSFPENSSQTL